MSVDAGEPAPSVGDSRPGIVIGFRVNQMRWDYMDELPHWDKDFNKEERIKTLIPGWIYPRQLFILKMNFITASTSII